MKGAPTILEALEPLHDAVQFEMIVLGAVLANAPACLSDLFDLLNRSDFHLEGHRLIYDALGELVKNGSPVDFLTVEDQLERSGTLHRIGGASYIAELLHVGLPTNFRYHAEQITEAATRKALHQAGRDVQALSQDRSQTLSETCAAAEQVVFRARRTVATSEFVPVAELAMDAIDQVENPDPKQRGMTTGFGNLDRLLFGWKAGELTLLCGRPSMGKTQLMLSMAVGAAHAGARVAIFSCEMDERALTNRMICALGGIDATRHALGELNALERSRFATFASRVGQLPIYINDRLIDRPVSEIRASARHYLRRHQFDVFWLDHLHRLPAGGNENANQAYTEIAKSLKSAARETGKPWNVLAQLSRNVERREDKRPALADLRESGTLEQEADKVLALYRPGYYKRGEGEDEAWPGETEVLVLKHRNGPVGVRKLWFYGPTGQFSENAPHLEAPPERRSYPDD